MVTSVHCPPSDKIHFILSIRFFNECPGPFENNQSTESTGGDGCIEAFK